VARYRVRKGRSGVSIELTEVARQDQELVASMDVQSHDDRIDIRLEPKPGEDLDTSEIAACLDHTVDTSRR
jgi:hypothetical protein